MLRTSAAIRGEGMVFAGGVVGRRSVPALAGGDLVYVVSVFGKHRERVLVEMSADEARALVDAGEMSMAGPARVVDALQRELGRIRERAPLIADSTFAAAAMAMAMEIEHPFNSAHAKSLCDARLAAALETIYEMVPPEHQEDEVDAIASRTRLRLAGGTAT